MMQMAAEVGIMVKSAEATYTDEDSGSWGHNMWMWTKTTRGSTVHNG
jgi:hypothetical protein